MNTFSKKTNNHNNDFINNNDSAIIPTIHMEFFILRGGICISLTSNNPT